MSFLDNSKTVGTAIWIVGIIAILLGIIGLIAGVLDDDTDTATAVIGGIGAIIVGLVYFGFGKDIRAGTISEKWDIVCRIVYLTGIVIIIKGLFGYDGEISDWAVDFIVSLIVGIIVLWIHKRMTDGNVDTLDKILWILLVVFTIIMIIVSLLSIVTFPIGTVYGILGLIIGLFVLVALFDNDVKSKMGM